MQNNVKLKFLSVEMTKVGLRYLKSPAHSQPSFRPKESEAKLKLKLMLDEKLLKAKSYYEAEKSQPLTPNFCSSYRV